MLKIKHYTEPHGNMWRNNKMTHSKVKEYLQKAKNTWVIMGINDMPVTFGDGEIILYSEDQRTEMLNDMKDTDRAITEYAYLIENY